MISKEIENLIVKYISQAATAADLDVLNKWIKDDRNHVAFKDFVKTHFAITLAMNDSDINKIKEELQKEINRDKKANYNRRFLSVMKYAAIAIFFIGVGIIWQQGIFENTEADIIIPRTDVITLELENGDIEVITEAGTTQVQNSNGKVVGVRQGNKLVYDQSEELKLVYNTLTVPNGKQFNIVLSDGSNVHLNSGSSIKYPINFIKGQKREVFLTAKLFLMLSMTKKMLLWLMLRNWLYMCTGQNLMSPIIRKTGILKWFWWRDRLALKNPFWKTPTRMKFILSLAIWVSTTGPTIIFTKRR